MSMGETITSELQTYVKDTIECDDWGDQPFWLDFSMSIDRLLIRCMLEHYSCAWWSAAGRQLCTNSKQISRNATLLSQTVTAHQSERSRSGLKVFAEHLVTRPMHAKFALLKNSWLLRSSGFFRYRWRRTGSFTQFWKMRWHHTSLTHVTPDFKLGLLT